MQNKIHIKCKVYFSTGKNARALDQLSWNSLSFVVDLQSCNSVVSKHNFKLEGTSGGLLANSLLKTKTTSNVLLMALYC